MSWSLILRVRVANIVHLTVSFGSKHANIIKFEEFCVGETRCYLVLEYVVGGDLYELLREGKGLNEGVLRDVFIGIASGLSYCHGYVPSSPEQVPHQLTP